MIHFAISGALGRMGRAIAEEASAQNDLTYLRGMDSPANPSFGQKIEGLPEICEISSAALEGVDGVIDFALPPATMKVLPVCVEQKAAMVIGTTGFSESELGQIKEASQEIPILMGSNMSVGVNLLFALTRAAARALNGKNYDAEITEIHHKHKKDAPSGTAKTLEEIILENYHSTEPVYGRAGHTGERRPEELGVFALRGGDVVGDHTVFFLGSGERIELKHQAVSRSTFASGALNALKFVVSKEPGFYSMADVLNLEF